MIAANYRGEGVSKWPKKGRRNMQTIPNCNSYINF